MSAPTVEQIIAVLSGVEDRGDSWQARCPFHDDKKQSLNVKEGTDGKPLVHCYAGCEDIYKRVCALVKNSGASTFTKIEKREFEGTYALVAEKAAALANSSEGQAYLQRRGIALEVAARLNWGFSEFRFNGQLRPALMIPHYCNADLIGYKARTIQGKEFSQLPGSSIDGLYGTSELDAFADEVLIFEGPEDAALAISHGFNSVAIVAAGSKISSADVLALTQFKRIFIIGDQDVAGKAAMDRLQKQIPTEQAIRVRIPGFKDVGELWAKNPKAFAVTLRQMLRFAQSARECFGIEDLLTEAEMRERQKDFTPYVVDKIIPQNSITMFFGEEKSGKSLLATYLLKCIANAQKVFGVLPVSKRPVLYLDRENSNDDIAGMTEHFIDLGPEPIRYRTRVTGCPEPNDPNLISFCETYKPVLVFDSLTKFLQGADPFNPKDMSELFDSLLNLCAAGATVILIHHATKADAEKYANSHQIGANVARAFAVISEDRPQLHKVCLKPKLFRGAEPETFNLVAFPTIAQHGCFGMSNTIKTDADLVLEWIRTNKPDGCTRKEIKEGFKGLRIARKYEAIKEALADARLIDNDGVLQVPRVGNRSNSLSQFPVAGTNGNQEQESLANSNYCM